MAETPAPASDAAVILSEVRRLFVDRIGAAVTEAGGFSAPAVEAMCRGCAQFYDEMIAPGGRGGFEKAKGLTASKLTLLDDSQLEIGIRLGDMSRHLADECAAGLAKLHARFVTLLKRPNLGEDDNPVGPEAITCGTAELFAEEKLAHRLALARLGPIETRLLQDLPLLYAEINELLVRHQVAAAPRLPTASDSHGFGGRQGEARAAGTDPIATLQQMVMGRLPAGAAPPAAGGGVAGMAAGGGLAVDHVAAVFNANLVEQLIALLQDKQRSREPDLFGGGAPADDTATLQALRTGEFGRMAGGQEAATLDTLALIFQAIFDNQDLPEAVKAAIARLQIPLLKAAILDPGFFADRNHPARSLLDAMARAAAGLGPHTDGEHPVCIELRRIAACIQGEFERDPDVFARHAAELETFIARRQHELHGAAQGYIELAQQQETRDLADFEARRALEKMPLAEAPPEIAGFLRQHWRKALAAAYLSGGESGSAWQAAAGTVTELLWTIQPKADAEERKRVATRVPDLLRRMQSGLDQAGVPPQERAPFLDACLALQAAALRGKALPPAAAPGNAGTADDAVEVIALESAGLRLLSMRPARTSGRGPGERVARLGNGDWLEFEFAPGDVRFGRLTWTSPMLGNPLLANPAWDCAISIAKPILERQLADGRARLRGAGSLFDNAADLALQSLATGAKNA